MRGWLLAACAVAACAPPPTVVVTRASCNAGPYRVWLDFDGASLAHGATDDATATPLQSLLAQSSVAYPAFDAAVSAPRVTRQQAVDAVVDRVRGALAGYAVDLTTTRPPAPPYSVVLVGGSHAALGATAGEGGLANQDCGNLADREVSYVFAADFDPQHGGLPAIANTVLHEVGHTFGLLHTVAQDDLMYSVAVPSLALPDLFTLRYGQGAYSSYAAGSSLPVPRPCPGADPVDNAALMACNAGTRAPAGDTTPPSLSWDVPAAATTTVTAPLTVSFSASDDTALARLEMYKNLELVAVLPAAPFSASISAAPGESFFVTAVAVDGAANRTTISRSFTVAGGADLGQDQGTSATDLGRAPAPPRAGGCSLAGDDSTSFVMTIMLLVGWAARAVVRRMVRRQVVC